MRTDSHGHSSPCWQAWPFSRWAVAAGPAPSRARCTYNDQPLPSGTVDLHERRRQGQPKADIQPDGTYKIDKMPTGPAKIAVLTVPVGGEAPGAGVGPVAGRPSR